MRVVLFIPLILASILFAIPWELRSEEIPTLPEKAAKYYQVLKRSPSRAYLFERFIDAWLEERSIGELPIFLEHQASRPDAILEDLLVAGYFYLNRSQFKQALPYFKKAADRAPDDPLAHTEIARLLAHDRKFKPALVAVEKALSNNALQKKHRLRLGKLKGTYLARLGNSDEAIATWQALLEDFPDDRYLHEEVIDELVKVGMLEEAVANAKELKNKSTDPYDKILLQLRIAEILRRDRKYDHSLNQYKQALEHTGAGSWFEEEILVHVATIFRQKDDINGLLEWIQQQSKRHPQRLGLLRRQALLEAELGHPDRAIELYESLLQKDPGNALLHQEFVKLLENLKRYDRAISEQQKIVDLTPDRPAPHVRLAEIHLKAKAYDLAAETYLHAFAMKEATELDHLNCAHFLETCQKPQLAEQQFFRALQQFPDSASLIAALGTLYFDTDRPDEAIALLREHAQSADSIALTRYTSILIQEGHVEKGLSLLRNRKNEFENDYTYLETLISLSTQYNSWGDIDQSISQLLKHADSAEKLEHSIELSLAAYTRQNGLNSLKQHLTEASGLHPAEIALLAKLHQIEGSMEASDAVIIPAIDHLDAPWADILTHFHLDLLIERKDWEQAEKIAQKIYNTPKGQTIQTRKTLIKIYRGAKNYTPALALIEEWKLISPHSVEPWKIESNIYLAQGKATDAISCLHQAATKFPDSNTDFLTTLAKIHHSTQSYEEAYRIHRKLFEQATSFSQRSLQLNQIIALSHQLRRSSDIVQELVSRARSNPKSVDPLMLIAQFHKENRNQKEEEIALSRALRITPDNLRLHHRIADSQLARGDAAASIASLNRALEYDATPTTRLKLININLNEGSRPQAYQDLEALAEEVASEHEPLELVLEQIADHMISFGDYDIADEFLEKHIASYPKNYRLRYLRAVLLEKQVLLPEAVEAFLELARWTEEMEAPLSQDLTFTQQRFLNRFSAFGSTETTQRLDRSERLQLISEVSTVALNQEHHHRFSTRVTIMSAPQIALANLRGNRFSFPAQSLPMLRALSLSQLISIAHRYGDPALQREVIPELHAQGFQRSDLLLSLGVERTNNYKLYDLPSFRRFNGDKTLYRRWVENFNRFDRDPEISITASEIYQLRNELSHADPALSAALTMIGHHLDPTSFAKKYNETIDYLSKSNLTDWFDQYTINFAIQSLNKNEKEPSSESTHEKVRASLVQAIEKRVWSHESPPSSRFASTLIRHYSKSNQLDRLIALLDHLNTLAAKAPIETQRGPSSPKTSWERISQDGLSEIELDSFHPGFLALFNLAPSHVYLNGPLQGAKEKLKTYPIEKREKLSPLLQLLIIREGNDESDLPLANEVYDDKSASADELILAARALLSAQTDLSSLQYQNAIQNNSRVFISPSTWGKWGRRPVALGQFQSIQPEIQISPKRFGLIFRCLEKARRLTLNSKQRQSLDAAIAVLASTFGDHHYGLKVAGRQAIMSLIQENPTLAFDSSLHRQMKNLGMKTQTHHQAANQPKSYMSLAIQPNSYSNQGISNRIEKLIKDGHRDRALQLTMAEIRTMGRISRDGNRLKQAPDFKERLKNNKLITEVINRLNELSKSSDPYQLHEVALILHSLTEFEMSLRLLERVASLAPEYPLARADYLLVSARFSDPTDISTLFEALPTKILPEVIHEMTKEVAAYRIEYEYGENGEAVLFAATDQFRRYPKETHDKFLLAPLQLFSTLIQGRYGKNSKRPFIHDLRPIIEFNHGSPKVTSQNQTRRSRIIESFLETAEHFEALTSFTFTHQFALSHQNIGHLNNWIEAAEIAISLDREKQLLSSEEYTNAHILPPILGPMDYLVREAALKRDHERIRTLIEPLTTEEQAHLTKFSQLFLVAPKDFKNAASDFLESAQTDSGHQNRAPFAYFSSSTAISPYFRIIWAASTREFSYSHFMETSKAIAEKHHGSQADTNWIRTLFHYASEAEGYPGHIEALRDFKNIWLGPNASKTVAEAQLAQAEQRDYDLPRRFTTFQRTLMPALAQDIGFLFPCAQVIDETGFKLDSFIDRDCSKYETFSYYQDHGNLFHFLDSSPWLGKLSIPQFICDNRLDSSETFYEWFLKHVPRQLTAENKSALKTYLSKKPDTFQRSFLLLFLEDASIGRTRFCLSLIGKYISEFEALPLSEQLLWHSLFENLGLCDDLPPTNIDEHSSRNLAVRWLQSTGATTSDLLASNFLHSVKQIVAASSNEKSGHPAPASDPMNLDSFLRSNRHRFSKHHFLSEFLQQSSWFEKLDQVNLITFHQPTERKGYRTLFEYFHKDHASYSNVQEIIRRFLDTAPPSFMKSWFEISLDQSDADRQGRYLTLIGQYLDEFEALTLQEQSNWISLFETTTFSNPIGPIDADKHPRQALAARWLTSLGLTSAQSIADHFLQHDQFANFKMKRYEFARNLNRQAENIEPVDPKNAIRIILHGTYLLYEESAKNGEFSRSDIATSIIKDSIKNVTLESEIIEETMAESDMSDAHDRHRLSVYFEILERYEEALALCRSTLKGDPDFLPARSQLVSLLARDHKTTSDDLRRIMDEVNPSSLPEFSYRIATDFFGVNRHDRKLIDRDKLASAFLSQLKRIPSHAPPEDTQIFLNVFKKYIFPTDEKGISKSSLHDLSPQFESYQVDGLPGSPLDLERHQVIKSFLEACSQFPRLKRVAFMHRHSLAMRQGNLDPKFWAIEAKHATKDNPIVLVDCKFNLASRIAHSPFLSPEEFLIKSAQTEEEKKGIRTLIEGLPEELRGYHRAYSDLYHLPESQQESAVERFLTVRHPSWNNYQLPYYLIWAASDKKLDYNAMRSYLKPLFNDGSRTKSNPSWVRTYLHHLAKSSSYPGHQTALTHFTEDWFSQEFSSLGRQIKLALAEGEGKIKSDSPFYSYRHHLMPVLAQDIDFLFPVVKTLKELQFPLSKFLYYNCDKYRDAEYFKHESPANRLISVAPWFGRIGDAEFVYDDHAESGDSLLNSLTEALATNKLPSSTRDLLRTKPDSIVKSYLQLFVEVPKEARQNAALRLIGENIKEFQSLAPQQVLTWKSAFEASGIFKGHEPTIHDDDSPIALASRWLESIGILIGPSEVNKFLSAKTHREIAEEEYRFKSRLEEVVIGAAEKNPDLAIEVLFHGLDLIDAGCKRGDWNVHYGWNGQKTASELVEGIIEDLTIEGRSLLAFYLKLRQYDPTGARDTHSSRLIHKTADAMYSMMRGKERSVNFEQTIPSLLTELNALSEFDPSRHTGDVALAFSGMAGYLSNHDRIELIKITDSIARSNSSSAPLAKILAAAARHQVLISKNIDPELKKTAQAMDLTSWHKTIFELQKLETNSPSITLAISSRFSEHPSPDFSIEAANNLAVQLKSDRSVDGSALVRIVRRLQRHSAHPEWNEVVRKILDAWWERNRYHQSESGSNRSFRPFPSTILTMIDLSLQAGDRRSYTRFENTFNKELSRHKASPLPSILIKYGYFEEAEAVLRERFMYYDCACIYPSPDEYIIPFSPTFRERMDEFSIFTSDPQLYTFAFALCASFQDPPKTAFNIYKSDYQPRIQRMSRAVQLFENTDWTNHELLFATLQQIAHHAPAFPHLPKEASQIDIYEKTRNAINASSSHKAISMMRAPAAIAISALSIGDPDPIRDLISYIIQSSSNAHYRHLAVKTINLILIHYIHSSCPLDSSDSYKKLQPALSSLIYSEWPDDPAYSYLPETIAYLVTLSAISGNSINHESFFNSFPIKKRTALIEPLNKESDNLIYYFSKALSATTEHRNSAEQIRITLEFLNNPMINSAILHSDRTQNALFSDLIKHDVLKIDDIFAASKKFQTCFSERDQLLISLWNILDKNDDLSLRIALGEEAVKMIQSRGNVKKYHYSILIGHAENLLQAKRFNEISPTLKLLSKDHPKLLRRPAILKRFNALQSTLNQGNTSTLDINQAPKKIADLQTIDQ